MRLGGRHLGYAGALALLGLASCGGGEISGPRDTGLDGLTLTRIDPGTVVPGTRLAIGGKQLGKDIPGEDFYNALLRIWIGDKPIQDNLKEALLGKPQ